MSDPLKKVLRFELLTTRYNRSGEGSYKFTLECGHTVWAKQSSGEPRRKRCRDCGRTPIKTRVLDETDESEEES